MEDLIGTKLPKDYLSSLELGALVRQYDKIFRSCFANTFGEGPFGMSLFELTSSMLSLSPKTRPSAEMVLSKLIKSI